MQAFFRATLQRISNMSFFVKTSIAYSVILSISILITGYIIVSNFSHSLEEKEIIIGNEALKKLASYTEIKCNQINNINIQMYTSIGIGATLTHLSDNPDMSYDSTVINAISNFIGPICSVDKDILDFIIVTEDNVVYHRSYYQSREVSPSYDFLNDGVIKKMLKTGKNPSVFYDDPSRYVISGSGKTISFVGRIYNTNLFPRKESVGVFIINYSLNAFDESYKELGEKTKGEFTLVSGSGEVLYCSNSALQGRALPYFKAIGTLNGNKLMLDKPYYVHTLKVPLSDITAVNMIPQGLMWMQLNQLKWKMSGLLLISLLTVIFFTSLIFMFFTARIKLLMQHMRKVQKGDLDTRIAVSSHDEIGQLGEVFNEMCERLNAYIKRVYHAEIKRKAAELSTLQSQINPHFLFNTIETIRMRALKDKNEKLEKMLYLLGNLFRWNVKVKDKIVRIEDELDYISSYLELQKLRFDDKLEFDVIVDDEILDLAIPKLLLQPILENSVMHGLGSCNGNGLIRIEGTLNEGLIMISIADNGTGIDAGTVQSLKKSIDSTEDERDFYSIGLRNVQQRIRLIFGDEYGLEISSECGIGTVVKIKIPAKSKKEMDAYVQSFDC